MFDLDPGKLIVIGIVALIAIPSKDLPRVMRALGQMMGKARRMSAEFQGQFMEAMREMEVADLKKEIEDTNKSIMNNLPQDVAFDPLTEARKQITSAVEGKPRKVVAVPTPEEPVPHPEEQASARVSKDDPGDADRAASFESRPSTAPPDEGVEAKKKSSP